MKLDLPLMRHATKTHLPTYQSDYFFPKLIVSLIFCIVKNFILCLQ